MRFSDFPEFMTIFRELTMTVLDYLEPEEPGTTLFVDSIT